MNPEEPRLLNKLNAIKLLLNDSKKAMGASGVQRAFAILHAHDALDWTLQLVYASLENSKKKKNKVYLKDYASEIEMHYPGLINQSNISKLNTLRNNFKHDFLFPDPDETNTLILWVENEIRNIIKTVFGNDLNQVDLINAISNKLLRARIDSADKKYALGQKINAFAELAIAFEVLKYDLESRLEESTNQKVVFDTDFTFYDSFHLKLDLLGNDFGRAWDQLIDGVSYLSRTSLATFIGIDLNQYMEFMSVTPRPLRMMSGDFHCDVSSQTEEKIHNADYSKYREFLIDAAIKAQSKLS